MELVASTSQVYVMLINELRAMLGWMIREIKCSVPQKHKQSLSVLTFLPTSLRAGTYGESSWSIIGGWGDVVKIYTQLTTIGTQKEGLMLRVSNGGI